MTQQAAATVWYAYAIVGPAGDAVRAAVPDLEVVGTDSVAVAAMEVPLSEYGEEVLPLRLNDRVWLEGAARTHEAVVERLAAVTTVLPLRFGSLHRDRGLVEAFVAERREELAAKLDRLRGRVELGLKVWLNAPRDTAAAAHRGAASGREYLERRKEARERSAVRAASLDARLQGLHERLLAVADAGVLNRPQPRELSGSTREMVLNAAYLVPAADASLARTVSELQAAHDDLELELTGPWAPYNFADLEEAR